jgi:RNA polymerase sigma-70 factor, ECF subfamily
LIDCSKKEVIEYLYKKMGQAALRKTFCLVQRHAIAEELVQDVFIKLYSKGNKFTCEVAVYSWIYKSCHNAGIDYLRRFSTKYETDADFEEMKADFSENQVGAIQTIRFLLDGVKERDLKIYLYSELDEMPQDEIASFLNISRKTVVRSLSKTRDYLLEKVKKI